jgi:hypothetical protein
MNSATRLAYLLLALAGVAALGVLFFFDPAEHAFYPRCPLHALTGRQCPTCGGLRAAHLLLHGRFRDAFALNPALLGVLPVAALFLSPIRSRAPSLPWVALAALCALAFLR